MRLDARRLRPSRSPLGGEPPCCVYGGDPIRLSS